MLIEENRMIVVFLYLFLFNKQHWHGLLRVNVYLDMPTFADDNT